MIKLHSLGVFWFPASPLHFNVPAVHALVDGHAAAVAVTKELPALVFCLVKDRTDLQCWGAEKEQKHKKGEWSYLCRAAAGLLLHGAVTQQ